jgi:hypothetical protein
MTLHSVAVVAAVESIVRARAFKLLNGQGLEFEAFFTTSHVAAAAVTGGYLA